MPTETFLPLSFTEFQTKIKELGLEDFRARQVWEWVFKKGVHDFSKMTNLSLEVRKKLIRRFPKIIPDEIDRLTDPDGTIKVTLPFTSTTPEGESEDRVEAVAIPGEESMTFCLSSQIGCIAACTFCRTGKNGFQRNLLDTEIVFQLLALEKATHKKPTNIVFMGMGEPFFNRKEVFKAIDIFTDKDGMNLGTRRITISTVGIPSGIIELSERPGEVNLAVSLHAADNATRTSLVPINAKYPLEKLRVAIETYISRTSRRVTFEVVLLDSLNDGIDYAMNMAEFCKGLLCHVNLVRFNPFPGCGIHAASEVAEKEYRKLLKKAGIPVTVRQSRGSTILAACGQLAGK